LKTDYFTLFQTERNISMIKKALPSEITSYDLLKTFAVIIMIIDHMGHYFFPDLEWFRAVGRIGFPVWFFLVGYARGRDVSPKLMMGALVLIIGNVIVGMPILAFNALVSIALIRVSIDYIMKYLLYRQIYVWLFAALMFVLVIPTDFVTEYGAQGMLVAMYGYLVRNKDQITHKDITINFMMFSFVTFIIYQQLMFGFSWGAFLFMAVGTFIVRYYLLTFSLKTYPALGRKLPVLASALLQFCGRYTLEIYVVHLLLFKFMALALGMEGFSFLDFKIYNLEP
jgi:TraX protein